jgi:hypothetical protein
VVPTATPFLYRVMVAVAGLVASARTHVPVKLVAPTATGLLNIGGGVQSDVLTPVPVAVTLPSVKAGWPLTRVSQAFI